MVWLSSEDNVPDSSEPYHNEPSVCLKRVQTHAQLFTHRNTHKHTRAHTHTPQQPAVIIIIQELWVGSSHRNWICIFSALLNDNILLHNNIYLHPGNTSTCWPPNHASFSVHTPYMTTLRSIYGYYCYLKNARAILWFSTGIFFIPVCQGLVRCMPLHILQSETLPMCMCGMWTAEPKDSGTLEFLFVLEGNIHLNVCVCECVRVHVWGQADH